MQRARRTRRVAWIGWILLLAGSVGGVALARGVRHHLPYVKSGDLVVGLCDGTRDEQVWAASTQAFVQQGDRIFHDDKALGGTIAVSCDMCHPNAADTHPETYPKYRVQLGRVALLRDMINWCIENPVRGKPLAEDDPKMKALESYILAQGKGTALDCGRH